MDDQYLSDCQLVQQNVRQVQTRIAQIRNGKGTTDDNRDLIDSSIQQISESQQALSRVREMTLNAETIQEKNQRKQQYKNLSEQLGSVAKDLEAQIHLYIKRNNTVEDSGTASNAGGTAENREMEMGGGHVALEMGNGPTSSSSKMLRSEYEQQQKQSNGPSGKMIDELDLEKGKAEEMKRVNQELGTLHNIYLDLSEHIAGQQQTTLNSLEGQINESMNITGEGLREVNITARAKYKTFLKKAVVGILIGGVMIWNFVV